MGFLLSVSGTNRGLLRDLEGDNRTSHSRQVRAGLGAIILLTFVVTWASSAWTATTFGVDVYVGVAIGLLAGLIKLVWDRRVAVAATTKMAWARMVVALPISILMALPLALSLFGDYSTSVSKEGEREAIVEAYEADLAERKALEAEVDSLRRGQQFFQTMASAEVGGLTQEEAGLTDKQLEHYGVEAPSGTPPCGPRCKTYKQRAQGYRSALEAKKEELRALPAREELTKRQSSKLEELEQETTDAVTLFSELYDKAFQRPLIGLLFLVLVGAYAFVDLLPALERIFSADLYTRVQLARIKAQKKKLDVERAQKQGQVRKTRAAAWVKAIFYNRILEEADSEDVSLEKLRVLFEKLEQFDDQGGTSEVEDPVSRDVSQDVTDGPSSPHDLSTGYPDLRSDATAGDGPSASKRGTAPSSPEDSERPLLPPANGRKSD